VPRVAGGFAINAETEGKAVWEADTGNTENFVDSGGHGMVPYTAAKVRWGDGKLYFLLYAGDLDLEGKIDKADTPFDKDDSFRLEFSSGDDVRVVAVSVLGRVYDAICRGPVSARKCDSKWQSHAQVAIDRDGTLNRIHDNDEEWVVEMALPLHDLGIVSPGPGTRIRFAVSRCEVGYDGVHACGGWGKGERTGELALDP
jgi:hypothetical protein